MPALTLHPLLITSSGDKSAFDQYNNVNLHFKTQIFTLWQVAATTFVLKLHMQLLNSD
jgi:hypothetical protein